MTWSLVNTISTSATSLTEAELGAPFTYFYETFLPSRGWTVTANESGGATQTNDEGHWGISKAFTFADGVTITCNRLHEVEYLATDMHTYEWDGTPGAGKGASVFNDTTWAHGLRTGINNYHFLASDADLDSWCVIANKRLIYWSHPVGGMYMQGGTDLQRLYSLGLMACYEANQGVVSFNTGTSYMHHGQGGSFYLPAYVMTPSFTYFGTSSANTVIGQNTASDVYSRFTNTSTAYGLLACEFPSSVLVDGDYYLDLWPAYTSSLMLKTGATNLGVLA